jgi:hypothetical protein
MMRKVVLVLVLVPQLSLQQPPRILILVCLQAADLAQ